MKIRFIIGGVLALAATLQASTSYAILNFTQGPSGLLQDGTSTTGTGAGNHTGDYIGPYTGTLNGANVTLYCDDFPDHITFGQTGYTVYSTALTASASTLQADTRYGAANANTSAVFSGYLGTAYPSATTLYEEMAWLATQMQTTGQSSANEIAIQEAIWSLTDATGPKALDGTAELTGAAFTNATGTTVQGYQNWMNEAFSYVAGYNATTGADTWGKAGSYGALVAANWSVITDTDSAGCTTGGTGSDFSGASGCTPGHAGTSTGVQEFLAYSAAPVITTGGSFGNTPEPATFVLIGSGLLAGTIIGRRRRNRKSNL